MTGILAVLHNQGKRVEMSAAGPKRAALYDWRLVAKRYFDLMIPLAASSAAR